MKDIYAKCPIYKNDSYTIRLISKKDLNDLLDVYSDLRSVPFFNTDNCHGESFYFQNIEQLENIFLFWKHAYTQKWFVRFSIIDNKSKKVIGTIELFHRDSFDYFTNCGLLRIDLKSEYEKKDVIKNILTLVLKDTFKTFQCDKIATKAIKEAKERREALAELGFVLSRRTLIGNEDNKEYRDYYVKSKK